MLIVGIDPGISGAICFFEDGTVKDVIEMPSMAECKKNKRQINGPQIFNEIQERINRSHLCKDETDNLIDDYIFLSFICTS